MRISRKPGPLPAAFDRGPAKYFHGRKQILRDFKELLIRATQTKSGTTFLIQGAPGAGKTALLHECEKLACSAKWKIADIDPPALWNPDELFHSLGLKRIRVEHGSIHVGVPGVGKAEIRGRRPIQTIKTLLQGKKAPLLLSLDEAQILGRENLIPQDQDHIAVSVLNAIHNGKLDQPVILLAAGLGTTSDAYRELSISRFSSRCLVELGALSKEAEQNVLRDWLTKDGKAKGDLTTWMDAIARETHGWPQHILSYVEPALNQLRADKKVMTTEGLHAVLKAGRDSRSEYYEHRAHEFSSKQRRSFAKLFANIPLGESMDMEDIMTSLTKEYGSDEAKELFCQALHKGILSRRRGDYTIPIPSMQDWPVSRYADT